ncbi:lysosomal acid lipase/cholesteryl ester hydrolase-like isoform X2 [Eublepharis macularius]|uniref:Lipase n=1 Tax=Eublepharis macularius TaxID=481883 RepID=A0AA97JJ31_EUBMA|nr:lysosomal acid lipase/cholesteryl ester hydrolase-like isoform X2 [Eublepharis macularius]
MQTRVCSKEVLTGKRDCARGKEGMGLFRGSSSFKIDACSLPRWKKMWWFVAIVCLTQAIARSEEFDNQTIHEHPEIHMNVSELIDYRGYSSEEYVVLTDDGHYLTINRILLGRKDQSRDPKPVVLVQHGIFTEASSWVANMANNSLGFILADAGYDVWLGNSRGTSWCQRHQNFSVDQDEFWDFSFHEMAMFDIPATINFILEKTGQKQLYYIGHSQGTTLGFIAFSVFPELSQKIKIFFALAPVISVKHASSPSLRLLLFFSENSIKKMFTSKDFIFSRKSVRETIFKICNRALMMKFCLSVLSSGGFNAENTNMSRTDIYLSRIPDGGSVKTLLHWRQISKSGLFRYFDYGSENQAKYNQSSPPSYNLQDMIVPTAIWSGEIDPVADPYDMAILLPQINNIVYYHSFSDWSHWDFVLGLNAPERLYYKIIEMMGKSL